MGFPALPIQPPHNKSCVVLHSPYFSFLYPLVSPIPQSCLCIFLSLLFTGPWRYGTAWTVSYMLLLNKSINQSCSLEPSFSYLLFSFHSFSMFIFHSLFCLFSSSFTIQVMCTFTTSLTVPPCFTITLFQSIPINFHWFPPFFLFSLL